MRRMATSNLEPDLEPGNSRKYVAGLTQSGSLVTPARIRARFLQQLLNLPPQNPIIGLTLNVLPAGMDIANDSLSVEQKAHARPTLTSFIQPPVFQGLPLAVDRYRELKPEPARVGLDALRFQRCGSFMVIKTDHNQALILIPLKELIESSSRCPAKRTVGSSPPAHEHHLPPQVLQLQGVGVEPMRSVPVGRSRPQESMIRTRNGTQDDNGRQNGEKRKDFHRFTGSIGTRCKRKIVAESVRTETFLGNQTVACIIANR